MLDLVCPWRPEPCGFRPARATLRDERLVPAYHWALSVPRIALDLISSQNSPATRRPLPDIFCHRLRLSFQQRPKRVIFIGSRLTFDVPPNQTSHKSSLLFLTWSPSQTATEPLSTNLATEAVFVGYSGAPFSNRAFNLRLRSACRALGVGEITAPVGCATPSDNPPQPGGKGFAGNPGAPPPQEYSHDSPLHPRRLRTNTADCGGTQPGVGVK